MRRETTEIFRFEYHPVDELARRIRVLTSSEEGLQIVTEKRVSTGWDEIDTDVISYFEYSDEETRGMRDD